MRLIKRVFWFAILALVAIFAIINMHNVRVEIDPFGLDIPALTAFEMPLSVVIFATLAIGLLVGVVLENDRGRPVRREMMRQRAEIAQLKQDAARMQKAMKDADHPDSAGLPVRRA